MGRGDDAAAGLHALGKHALQVAGPRQEGKRRRLIPPAIRPRLPSPGARTMADGSTRPARIKWTSFATVISAAILIGTEIVGAGLATGWGMATMVGFGGAGA